MTRYRVVEGSQTAHCCFTHTVVDTTRPDLIGGEQYVDERIGAYFEIICECFGVEDAENVTAALNRNTP